MIDKNKINNITDWIKLVSSERYDSIRTSFIMNKTNTQIYIFLTTLLTTIFI